MNKSNTDDGNSTLFYARNEYYIGNFMGCINFSLAEKFKGNSDLTSYMYLSYLAIGSGRLTLSEIKENDPTPLVALRYFYEATEYPDKFEEVLSILNEKCSSENDNGIWRVVTAMVYSRDGQFENALKILNGFDNLEALAVTVQCLLVLNRIDLAKHMLTKMQEINDDATLTQLAQAWVAVSTNTEQMQDAFHIFQEFSEKSQPTSILLNGQAICHLGQKRYEEAETVLREVLASKHDDYDGLVNTMVLTHLKGSEVVGRYLEQLKQLYPKSDCVSDLESKSLEFDQLCEKYSHSIANC